jgi:hypothetical protein
MRTNYSSIWRSDIAGGQRIIGHGMAKRIALEIAQDMIAVARASREAVTFVTGNSFMPPLRSYAAADLVWNADNGGGANGELWETLVEELERILNQAGVYLDRPEYDNALYVVDLARWQYREEATGDDLNDEWEIAAP